MMSDDNVKKPLGEHFFARVASIALAILVLYFVMSPYQNCLRDVEYVHKSPALYCAMYTDW